jgi:hypothetical protein
MALAEKRGLRVEGRHGKLPRLLHYIISYSVLHFSVPGPVVVKLSSNRSVELNYIRKTLKIKTDMV